MDISDHSLLFALGVMSVMLNQTQKLIGLLVPLLLYVSSWSTDLYLWNPVTSYSFDHLIIAPLRSRCPGEVFLVLFCNLILSIREMNNIPGFHQFSGFGVREMFLTHGLILFPGLLLGINLVTNTIFPFPILFWRFSGRESFQNYAIRMLYNKVEGMREFSAT